MTTSFVPTVNSRTMDDRRPFQSMAAFFVALGGHVQMGIHIVNDLMERSFAGFAGVPYQNPLSRQQWEDLWDTEAEPQLLRISIGRLKKGTRELPGRS